ncbi:MAG: response regulator [Chitinophagales bacterium]
MKILIFEDNRRIRESLELLLSGIQDFEVTGTFENAANADHIASVYHPDVVIMDIDMPGTNGIEGVRLIKEADPKIHIIMFTVFEDENKLFNCLAAGANGYILKNTPPQQLIQAIIEVNEGGAPMSPGIARKVLESFRNKQSAAPDHDLSAREIQILKLLVQGFSYKMIASACKITLNTVRTHLKNIYTKLHVSCGKEAISKALKDKIVKLE